MKILSVTLTVMLLDVTLAQAVDVLKKAPRVVELRVVKNGYERLRRDALQRRQIESKVDPSSSLRVPLAPSVQEDSASESIIESFVVGNAPMPAPKESPKTSPQVSRAAPAAEVEKPVVAIPPAVEPAVVEPVAETPVKV